MSTAMIIDTDALGRCQLRVALQRAGYDVRSAETLLDAEGQGPVGDYALVAIDGTLRPTEALAALGRWRERGWKGEALYVAERVTDPQLDELSRMLGVRYVFLKPLAFGELCHRLSGLAGANGTAARGRELDVPATWSGPLQAVRQDAFRRLPGEVSKLDKLVRQGTRAPDKEVVAELHRLAHTLHGTAGTYRFVVVSDAAGGIESLCARILSRDLPVDDRDTWRSLRAYVEVMRAWLPEEGSAREPDTLPAAPARPAMLLVTDDDAVAVHYGQRMEGHDLTLWVARTPGEAEAYAQEMALEAAVVDLDLPDDGARRVLHALRRRPALRDLPVAWLASPRSLRSAVGPEPVWTRNADALTFRAALDALRRLRTQKPCHVVLVDDDSTFAAAVAAMLEPHRITVTHVASSVGLLEQLERLRPDLVLLDLLMPFVSGYDAARELRASPRWSALPIVVVTAQTSAQVRLATYAAGADDFLLKPVVGDELVARVLVQLERVKRLHDRDECGVLRRRAFLDAAEAQLTAPSAEAPPSTAVLVKLSGLRALNTSLGFAAGDVALRGAADALRLAAGPGGLVGRWSGTTLAGVLPEVGGARAAVVLAKLAGVLQDQVHHTGEGRPFRATVRLGWATSGPQAAGAEALLLEAEAHLATADGAAGLRTRLEGGTRHAN